MYRLLTLSTIPFRKYPNVTLTNYFANDLENEKVCILCKQLQNISKIYTRRQSTNLYEHIRKERKKRKTSKKKYSDVLMVSENSFKQQKATIQKLTSKDVKLLVNSSLNLNELYKLKDNKFIEEHSYSDISVIESVASLKTDLLPDEQLPEESRDFEVVPEIELNRLHRLNSFQPEVLDESQEIEPDIVRTTKERKNTTKTENLQQYRDEIVTNTLAAFIEICGILKTPQRGLNALHFHRHRTGKLAKRCRPLTDVKIYNSLLKAFAVRGSYEKCTEILSIAKEDNVELNLHSYVILLECLGRINNKNSHLKNIKTVVKEALSKDFTFDRMMNDGVFLNDEREIVLKALKAYDPNYIPKYDQPSLQYKNHLVNCLNNDFQLNWTSKKYNKANGGLFTPKSLSEKIDKQLEYEKASYITIKSIEARSESTEEIKEYRKVLSEHYKMWEESAQTAFVRDLSTLTAQRSAISFEPYMRSIPVKEFVTIIVDEAIKLAQGSETYSPTVHMLHRSLGNRVYAKYMVLRKQKTGVLDKIKTIHNKYCEQYATNHPKLDILPNEEILINSRQQWQLIENEYLSNGATLSMGHQEWVPSVMQFIGKFLYHIVMHDLKIDVNSLRLKDKNKNFLPAFYTIFRSQGRIVKEEVKPHPILSRLYRSSVPETLTFPTCEVPMVCPPVPWTSTETGGFLLMPCDVMRLPPQAQTPKKRLLESESEQLYPSLDALNQLASVPWKVNERMLDIIIDVFNNGGSSKLDVPEPTSSLQPPPAATSDMEKSDRYKLFRQRLQFRRKKAEMYGLWCDCLYRLSLANHFRNNVFWLPHNMDFRGRVYPVPPHLNHLGSDLARSILVFAEARPLGPNGLNWLKLHLINLTGLKKRDPVEERLKYADDVMDLILDSAENPLNGKKWWQESDEPWQTLACCIEIANVLKSGNAEEHLTHFPIHQDGSCNGLQHYAALGRDKAGAYSVNLTPDSMPQDVYSAVVALVEEQRQKDAENGMQVAQILNGFVKRKVIKQTVMTTVYGVTRYGARLQIARQLKDIDDFPKEHVWAASHYLTARTFESLRTMFTSTKEIQDWFTECARLISAVCEQQVEWVTPIGLPVVQPYFRSKKLNIRNGFESYPIDTYEKPNVMKQKNAFPPNFIHSLDSSHMMLTSMHCERAGITFVSVHDCYWTHPSTVHIMNKICRDQFVALHSEPILEDLSDFLTRKFSYNEDDLTGDGSVLDLTKRKLNRALKKIPTKGDFDIKQVLDSVYFFS